MNSETPFFEEKEHKPLFVFDLNMLIRVYSKRFKRLLIITAIAMALAALWTLFRVGPVWKASCYIIRAPKNMTTPVDMPYLYQSYDINTVLETVRTRDVLSDVIERLQLKITPEELYKRVTVQRGNRSNILRFTVSWGDAQTAAIIANTTAESFIFNNTKLQNSAALKIYNYYLEQQKSRLALIDDLTLQFEAHRAKHGIISIPHETQTKFDQLKELEIKMIENSLKVREMDSKIAEMDEKIAKLPDEVVMSWTYTDTDERRILALEKELEALTSRYTNDNPKVRKVLTELNELKAQMKKKTRDLPETIIWGPSGLSDAYNIDKVRYQAEREGALEKNKEFRMEVNGIKASLENLTALQKEFFEIERQLELNKDILRIVEGRIAESKMAMQSNVSDFEILEAAQAPEIPEGGKRKLMVLLTGMVVFTFGSLYVLGKELLHNRIRSENDFNCGMKIPMMACLPDENHVDKHVFYRNFQVMINDIYRKVEGDSPPMLAFGSDVPEAGKSFIIKELSQMITQKQRNILYIDTIRESSPALQDYIINDYLYEISDSFAIDNGNTAISYAYFLADETTFTSTVEPERVKEFISLLKRYDLVIWELFDFPFNIQLFSNIAQASSILLMVARFDVSNRNRFCRLVQFLKERDFHDIYGVLNYVHKDYFNDKY